MICLFYFPFQCRLKPLLELNVKENSVFHVNYSVCICVSLLPSAMLSCVLLQVMLCNPVCIVGYTIASWRFFRERIEEEELSLIHFFAEEYVEYKRKIPTGLPFISGIRVN
ncbi:hypothetical protein XENOCAPTIV_000750 [Xenoophorus captivus]|uniref:Protein-S-isoprenylcysteine O-methyltransferase n=1 Tax=Xenoophorus captivus TaxID=1517983 RepID=A0ABV0SDI8_9TELE